MATKNKQQQRIHKHVIGAQREHQKQAGFFDGRFVVRAETSLKVYQRHVKHRKKQFEY